MKYKLDGVLKNPKDIRAIKLAQVQSPVEIPKKYKTDISWIPVFDQKKIGSCVGHAHAIVHIYNEYKETGIKRRFSPRYLYALSKKIDGVLSEGTYPRVMAKIQTEKGCATEDTVENNCEITHAEYINIQETDKIKEDAYPYRIGGYTDTGITPDELKQAIYQNGVVPMTISVKGYRNPIKKGNLGYHRICLYGYDNNNKFYYRNSWGEKWGNGGDGYFKYKDQDIIDPMAFLDIPNEILEKAKAMPVVKITRTYGAESTLGKAIATKDGKEYQFNTLELPWANNKRNVSCIPAGTYQCVYEYNEKYKCGIYRVKSVTNRYRILWHPGNWPKDTEGCILPGKTMGINYVGDSRKALSELCTFMENKDFTLVIK